MASVSLDRKLSDHCLVVLKDIELDFGPKPFRFFDVWLQESDIEKVVSFAWALSVRSRRPDCIYRDKLKNVKSALKSWSMKRFGKLDDEINLVWKLQNGN